MTMAFCYCFFELHPSALYIPLPYIHLPYTSLCLILHPSALYYIPLPYIAAVPSKLLPIPSTIPSTPSTRYMDVDVKCCSVELCSYHTHTHTHIHTHTHMHTHTTHTHTCTHTHTHTCTHATEVTKILTFLAQASHELIPPEVSGCGHHDTIHVRVYLVRFWNQPSKQSSTTLSQNGTLKMQWPLGVLGGVVLLLGVLGAWSGCFQVNVF